MKTLFYNANPVNIDQCEPFEAFLVEKGTITKTGTYAELKQALSSESSLVDLKGKPIIPGLTDCHIHLLAYAVSKEKNVNLKDVSSLKELQDKTGHFLRQKDLNPGSWLSGWGWNQDLFTDRKMPDTGDLDIISTEHPIKLTRMCYHICIVNSYALEIAGITAKTPDPEGGKIDRDVKGNPTGILRETAMELIDKVIPPLDNIAEIKDLIRSACADLVRYGFTMVHTDDFGHVKDHKKLLDAYLELDEEGNLPLEIVLQMIIHKPEDLDLYMKLDMKSGKKYNRLSAGPVKILGDGSLGSRTAALKEPYSDDPDTRGIMLFSEETLDKMIKRSFDNGFDVAVHAIGDLAQERVLKIYGKYGELIQHLELSPSIIHCQITSPQALEKYKLLDIVANFQPIFIHSDWQITLERVGEKRLETSYCWKTFIDRGIYCVGSSDAPVESFNPFWNIYAAVARKDLSGNPADGWVPEESLSREEALKLFTVFPHRLTKTAGKKGYIKEGFTADFVVLSEHPYHVSESRLKKITALATYKEGKAVFKA